MVIKNVKIYQRDVFVKLLDWASMYFTYQFYTLPRSSQGSLEVFLLITLLLFLFFINLLLDDGFWL